ncbi:acryloyl-CoA reductase electron transfer subunit beta [Peptococcaceae bacterium CEB3]|nr:acryloyl-CoA reductase electron transfer subunit beta [Peptococcaceae bacterium CEB3]
MSEIWVVAEVPAALNELIAHAKGLAEGEKIIALTFSQDAAQAAASHGADRVLCFEGGQRPEAFVDQIIERAQAARPTAVLWGASRRDKEMAARVAAALDAGLVSECFSVKRNGSEFTTERCVYGGLCVASEVSQAPFMGTLTPKTIEAPAESPAVGIEVISGGAEKCQVLEMRPSKSSSNLGEASVVVCVGRGVSKREDIELARRLAKKLDGEVGCTRPVAEDLHWLPEENYIGISGQTVKPSVYIGIGVSGQIQHISGIRDSKTIIAIEQNENAPILEAADYTLVGDLYQLLPTLLDALKA